MRFDGIGYKIEDSGAVLFEFGGRPLSIGFVRKCVVADGICSPVVATSVGPCSLTPRVVYFSNVLEVIGANFFADSPLEHVIFESNSRLRGLDAFVFCRSSLKSIIIPKSAEFIGRCCFDHCSLLISVTFEPDSQLSQVDEFAFRNCSFFAIDLPKSLAVVEGSAFSRSAVQSISVDTG
jgi:hypothetical protein